MNINRKNKTSNEISTSSLPDIIFMLLIFFMVTTVMREFEGLDIVLPKAETIEKLESKRHTVYVWATKEGLISVNDKIININDLSNVMFLKLSKDPKLTVSLRSDEDSRMELISEIHTQLRKAQALKLNYSSLTKETGS
ncbi:MAG: biopolymer transporter ExbD [Candidatus Marinimicrobia bacterium]|nr:biopolymer transporter ExbD [Candidatus Neomarinimicrobiota bacterium]